MGEAGVEHGHNVFRRHLKLDVVHASQRIAALFAEDVDAAFGFGFDFGRRLVGQDFLGVNAPPESQTVAELTLEAVGSMFLAVTCTGFSESTPMSKRCGMN